MEKDNISGFSTKALTSKQIASYSVEIYNGKNLMTVMMVKAKDEAEASAKAREVFFRDINAKVKRAWN